MPILIEKLGLIQDIYIKNSLNPYLILYLIVIC